MDHDFLWFGIQLLDVSSCLTFLSKFQDVTSLRSSTRDVGKEAYTSTRGELEYIFHRRAKDFE